jgi:hypothetical protein
MLRVLRIAFALSALLVTTPAAAAKPMKPDCEAALPAVQAAVAVACDCDTATSHGQYVRCAGQVVKGMVAASSLDRKCKGAMVRVFAKSTCGKPSHVTCCSATRPCKVKSASACERRGGTPGSTPFCADACASSPSGAFVE